MNDLFGRFLSRDNIESGSAVSSAKNYRGRRQSDEIRKEAIISAWNQIVTTPDESLIELIGNEYADILRNASDAKRRKVGQSKPKSKLVRDVLNENKGTLIIRSGSASEQSSDADSFVAIGKKPRSFNLTGTKHKADGWPKLLDALCESIYTDYAELPENFIDKMVSIKDGRYCSRNETDLNKPRPISSTGLYRPRQVPETHKRILEILRAFDYPEKSLEIEDTKRNGERFSLYWP